MLFVYIQNLLIRTQKMLSLPISCLSLVCAYPTLHLCSHTLIPPYLQQVDDLGWNDVSFHGGSDFETPNIDALAADSLQLSNYYTQHYCSPSRSALMSGRYPIHDGLQHEVIHEDSAYGLSLDVTTLPQQLKRAGYRTHMLGYGVSTSFYVQHPYTR